MSCYFIPIYNFTSITLNVISNSCGSNREMNKKIYVPKSIYNNKCTCYKSHDNSPEFIFSILDIALGSGLDTSEPPLLSTSQNPVAALLSNSAFSTCFRFFLGVLLPLILEGEALSFISKSISNNSQTGLPRNSNSLLT